MLALSRRAKLALHENLFALRMYQKEMLSMFQALQNILRRP
jgi:hypothetical protein